MKPTHTTRLLQGAVAAALLGLGTVPAAFAVDMEVKATVRNTLTATVDSALNFGELFVTEAKTDASAWGVRAPATAGTTSLTSVNANGLTFMSLGGSERGEVSVAIPPNNTTAYTVTLSGLVDTVDTGADCQGSTDGVLVLAHDSGNPAIPGFNVYAWTLAAGAGSDAVSTVTTAAGVTSGTVTPAFGAGPSVFHLGATIATSCELAGTYQEVGEYVGTLTIDVGY